MQLPTVKFVANELLTALNYRAVSPSLQAAVAHVQPATLGCERKNARHVVPVSIEVLKPLSEHEHPTAFGVDRPVLHELSKRPQALFTAAELGCMLLWEAARQDQPLGFGRDGRIGKGTPTEHGHAHLLKQFTGFLVAEVKGSITGKSHRKGVPLHRWDVGQRMGPLAGCQKQGLQAFHVQMLAGQSGPGLASLFGSFQFMGRGQAEMTARQGKGLGAR